MYIATWFIRTINLPLNLRHKCGADAAILKYAANDTYHAASATTTSNRD